MDIQSHTDPEEVASRNKVTRLLAEINIRMIELNDQLEAATSPAAKLAIKVDMAAQQWHRHMIEDECRKKGWL